MSKWTSRLYQSFYACSVFCSGGYIRFLVLTDICSRTTPLVWNELDGLGGGTPPPSFGMSLNTSTAPLFWKEDVLDYGP
jgi:hypothetical protein